MSKKLKYRFYVNDSWTRVFAYHTGFTSTLRPGEPGNWGELFRTASKKELLEHFGEAVLNKAIEVFEARTDISHHNDCLPVSKDDVDPADRKIKWNDLKIDHQNFSLNKPYKVLYAENDEPTGIAIYQSFAYGGKHEYALWIEDQKFPDHMMGVNWDAHIGNIYRKDMEYDKYEERILKKAAKAINDGKLKVQS